VRAARACSINYSKLQMLHDEVKEKYFRKGKDKTTLSSCEISSMALMARLNRLENKLELLIDKVIDAVITGTSPKTFL
jgi:hypothetical protein